MIIYQQSQHGQQQEQQQQQQTQYVVFDGENYRELENPPTTEVVQIVLPELHQPTTKYITAPSKTITSSEHELIERPITIVSDTGQRINVVPEVLSSQLSLDRPQLSLDTRPSVPPRAHIPVSTKYIPAVSAAESYREEPVYYATKTLPHTKPVNRLHDTVLTHVEDPQAAPKEKQYKKYTPHWSEEWDEDEDLMKWIKKVPTDPTKVFCTYCFALIRAHKGDIKNHEKSRKHQQRKENPLGILKAAIGPKDKNSSPTKSGPVRRKKRRYQKRTPIVTPDGTVKDLQSIKISNIPAACTDTDLYNLLGFYGRVKKLVRTAKHQRKKTCSVQMASADIAMEAIIDLHGATYKGNVLAVRPKKKYAKMYRDEWQDEEDYKNWLRCYPGTDRRAYCLACEKVLRCHITDIRSHSKSRHHLDHLNMFDKDFDECYKKLQMEVLGRVVEKKPAAKKPEKAPVVEFEPLEAPPMDDDSPPPTPTPPTPRPPRKKVISQEKVAMQITVLNNQKRIGLLQQKKLETDIRGLRQELDRMKEEIRATIN